MRESPSENIHNNLEEELKSKYKYKIIEISYIVQPVYKDHSREPENVAFMSRCLLYTG
jgi:hypothetical protein